MVSYDQNISLIFFMWKMDPMSGFDIHNVFTLPPTDSTYIEIWGVYSVQYGKW